MKDDLSKQLPRGVEPPPALEDRTVAALQARGLLAGAEHDQSEATPGGQPAGWRIMRYALATAAALALIAFGVLIGRAGLDAAPPGTLTGAESNLYALLLYETPGYDRPGAAQARARYDEYSRWVGEAYRREQFVTGEDLEVSTHWRLRPGAKPQPVSMPDVPGAGEPPPLSGIFFVRADDPAQVLELAQSLPHLRHGGEVVVQKTIPTTTPPP